MNLKVYSQDGKEKGTVALSDEIFGGEINEGLLHQVVTGYLANRRQGTSKTKSRDEVSGGGKKPWKQKGTGRARAGSNTSPVWVRGGKAFGPVPRNYGGTIPKKLRKAALLHAISSRVQNNKMLVIESIACDVPKTKTVYQLLKSLSLGGSKNLLVTDGNNTNLFLSGRNIPNLQIAPIASLNAYDVLVSENVILGTKDLVGKLEEAVAQ